MPEYADQPLPSLPFFFTQSTAEIRDQQQLVGHAAFAKRSLLNRPATFPSWEAHTHSAPTGLGQKAVEFQVMSAAPNHAFLSYAHELLAGAVYDAEALLRIESKDRHIDLHQHLLQQRDRLHRPQTLALKRIRKGIDLKNQFAKSIVATGTPRTEGKVFFSQCGDHVGKRL